MSQPSIQKIARCSICGGANRHVVNGGVRPCRSAEIAAIYRDAPSLPCGAALARAGRPASAQTA